MAQIKKIIGYSVLIAIPIGIAVIIWKYYMDKKAGKTDGESGDPVDKVSKFAKRMFKFV
jgi:hypothetical protein